MRVLMISSLWPPSVLGGAETYASELASQLRHAGHEVGVVTLGIPGPDVVAEVPAWPYAASDFESQPVSKRALYHLRDLSNPSARRMLRSALDDFRPDVVHSHSVPGLSGVVLAEPSRAGFAHVHTLHDYWLLCQRSSMANRAGESCSSRCRPCLAVSRLRSAQIHRHAPHVMIAVSRALALEHEPLAWVTDRLRVVHNPVETPRTGPKALRVAGRVTFGYLGRLTAAKGVTTLLDAFSRPGLDAARLVVAGEGPLSGTLARARVEERGWLDAVGKDRLFATVDVLVVPSQWRDPAPLVVGEARARGLPVIGSRIGGIPELVAPESAPLLFPAGDADALHQRMIQFARAPGAFRPRGSAGALPDWPEHLELVLAAYGHARAQAPAEGGR